MRKFNLYKRKLVRIRAYRRKDGTIVQSHRSTRVTGSKRRMAATRSTIRKKVKIPESNIVYLHELFDILLYKIEIDELNDLLEEELPSVISKAIRYFYPGDPITGYIIGKIGEETTKFAIIVLKSRKEDSTISIAEIGEKYIEERIYSVTKKLNFQNQAKINVQEIVPAVILTSDL